MNKLSIIQYVAGIAMLFTAFVYGLSINISVAEIMIISMLTVLACVSFAWSAENNRRKS